MRIRDVMTSDPVTIQPETPVHHAQQAIREHKIRNLPVVQEGKLVGMVTYDILMKVSPSKATGLSLHEIHYILAEMKVEDIMDRNPVVVSPDTPLEHALVQIQDRTVRGFPVVENERLVGIATRGDIIRLLAGALGLQEEGVRITIEGLGLRLGELGEIISIFDRNQALVLSMMTLPAREKKDWIAVIRLNTKDVATIEEDLKRAGFRVSYVDEPV